MSNEEVPDSPPTFRVSRCGLWAVCDNLAMGRTDDHLVTVTHAPMPQGEARDKMAAGRALLEQELQKLPPGNAFWLDIERVQADGNTEPVGEAMVMPAAFLQLDEPQASQPEAELQALLAKYTPQDVLELWRISNAWYVLNPPGKGDNETDNESDNETLTPPKVAQPPDGGASATSASTRRERVNDRKELHQRVNQLDLQINFARRSANRARRPDRKAELQARLASLRTERDTLQQALEDTFED